MVCSWWCVIAMCALVWLLPTVDEHVLFQNKSSTKWISTFCTFVNFLPRVGDHVPPQVPCFTNDFWHSEQVWVFIPLWVSMCVFRLWARPNDFWHWTHLCVFSLLWVIMCLFIFPDWANDSWHSELKWILWSLSVCEAFAILIWLWVAKEEHSAPWSLMNCEIWNFPLKVLIFLKLWFGSETFATFTF